MIPDLDTQCFISEFACSFRRLWCFVTAWFPQTRTSSRTPWPTDPSGGCEGRPYGEPSTPSPCSPLGLAEEIVSAKDSPNSRCIYLLSRLCAHVLFIWNTDKKLLNCNKICNFMSWLGGGVLKIRERVYPPLYANTTCNGSRVFIFWMVLFSSSFKGIP